MEKKNILLITLFCIASRTIYSMEYNDHDNNRFAKSKKIATMLQTARKHNQLARETDQSVSKKSIQKTKELEKSLAKNKREFSREQNQFEQALSPCKTTSNDNLGDIKEEKKKKAYKPKSEKIFLFQNKEQNKDFMRLLNAHLPKINIETDLNKIILEKFFEFVFNIESILNNNQNDFLEKTDTIDRYSITTKKNGHVYYTHNNVFHHIYDENNQLITIPNDISDPKEYMHTFNIKKMIEQTPQKKILLNVKKAAIILEFLKIVKKEVVDLGSILFYLIKNLDNKELYKHESNNTYERARFNTQKIIEEYKDLVEEPLINIIVNLNKNKEFQASKAMDKVFAILSQLECFSSKNKKPDISDYINEYLSNIATPQNDYDAYSYVFVLSFILFLRNDDFAIQKKYKSDYPIIGLYKELINGIDVFFIGYILSKDNRSDIDNRVTYLKKIMLNGMRHPLNQCIKNSCHAFQYIPIEQLLSTSIDKTTNSTFILVSLETANSFLDLIKIKCK
jgi:hypothetical protein